MVKITIEMPPVTECSVTECVYNIGQDCHARAITVGDAFNPDCDTFMHTSTHINNPRQTAGVGACKVTGCSYNDDFECAASSISVGYEGSEVHCLTYTPR